MPQLMDDKQKKMIKFMEHVLHDIEMDLRRVKVMLAKLAVSDEDSVDARKAMAEAEKMMDHSSLQDYKDEDGVQIVEGAFDGYYMIAADQKKYPVPPNYSSKTKLVPGDILKLKIMEDGRMIYKLIAPVERKHVKAMLSKADDGRPVAITDQGQTYFLNQAAVTFYKAKPGDDLYIIVNADGKGSSAAIETSVKQ